MLVMRRNRVSRACKQCFPGPQSRETHPCAKRRMWSWVGRALPVRRHRCRSGGMVESQEDPDMSDSASDCTELRSAVTEAEVEALVRGICFKTGPPRYLGVEVEWLVHELWQPRLPATPERLEAAYAALRTLPLRSALTVEPGGQ